MGSQEELALLERVFLRIGSATTDEELENVIGRFLTPVLLKLASQQEGVRKNVMELLVHINKRLKSRPKVLIPMEALLIQYQDPSITSFVTNFTILYLKDGYHRLPNEKQGELVTSLIQCLENKPAKQQQDLLQMIISALPNFDLPKDVSKKLALFGLTDKPTATRLLLDFMLDYLLLPYTFSLIQPEEAPAESEPARPATATAGTSTNQKLNTPPGLSINALKKLIGERVPDSEEIEMRKVGIVKFLSADILPAKDVACHLIVASADTRYKVATAADISIRRLQRDVNWNDATIINKLYNLFLGTVAIKGRPAPKPDDKLQPVGTRVRLKIFPFFLRSKEATNHFPYSLQVVFECLYGTSSHDKLKAMGLLFVHHMTLECSDIKLRMMGPILMSGMVKVIQMNQNSKQKGLAYTAVGKLSKRLPELITKDLSIVQNFFDALCKEDAEMRMNIQESLSMMTDAFQDMPRANLLIMEAIIMTNAEKVEPQARLASAQYAAQVFPSNHIPSRYVLLLNTADSKDDIRLMSLKAIRVGIKQDITMETEIPKGTDLMPKFQEMVNYIHQRAKLRLKGASRVTIGTIILPFTPTVFNEIIFYLRSTLVYETGTMPSHDTLEMQDQAPVLYNTVQKLLKTSGSETIIIYVELILQLLNASGESQAMYCLLEIVALSINLLSDMFLDKLQWIKNCMKSGRELMRDMAAQLLAIVANSAKPTQLLQILSDLLTAANSKNFEVQHGAILGLGYTIGRQYFLTRKAAEDVVLDDMEVDQSSTEQGLANVIQDSIVYIAKLLNSNQVAICIAACTAIGEISRNGTLPLPRNCKEQEEKKTIKDTDAHMEDDIKKAKMDEVEEEEKHKRSAGKSMKSVEGTKEEITVFWIVKKLSSKIYSIKIPQKLKEIACQSLGYLPVGDSEFPHTQEVLLSLLKSADTKQMELQFTVGEALSQAALAFHSPSRRDIWTETERSLDLSQEEAAKDNVEWLLLKILEEHVTSPNPHKKQAACIWLLSVVKRCGLHPALQCRFEVLQQAFMDLLSENSDFTQDVASKGLSLVYEQSSEMGRKELVTALVDRLMTGKRAKLTVTGDTELFKEGSFGKSPVAGGLTTYKELCSLASDLNQPDLLYKFMHLASHNAMWNSRKGAAFGFGTIAKQASEQLAPHLPKIVPRLYRYQYDPNSQIRQAMTSIWTALVADNKKVVDQYFLEILQDVHTNLTSTEWRNRESSCLALADLLRNRDLDNMVDRLPELWETCLRVRDDIKATVRTAADGACRQLSKVSIKLCDVHGGKVGVRALSLVLPCLLNGLTSKVDEVKELCLTTIVKIGKNAGKTLKPHIPLLVTALLESLSGLEDQRMNTLSLHVSRSQDMLEKLDDVRVAVSKLSPMMETINLCVQYVDSDVLKELVPRLVDVTKNGIGVGTKAGAANFMVMLSNHCPLDLEPYSGKLLSALLAGFSDRSSAVRKSNASALGHLVKVSKDSSVEKLINRLKSWYLEKDDDSLRLACGMTLHAISRHNPDVLKRHAAAALPLTFLAMHEQPSKGNSENVESIWEDIWLDSTPGTEGGVRLYILELVAIIRDILASQSWPKKAQGARAISTIAIKLGSNLSQPYLGSLLDLVVKGLAGRTWDGKEELLQALSSICTKCKNVLMTQTELSPGQPSMEDIMAALLKECKKNKVTYKMEALRCMSTILQSHDIDRFSDIAEILYPVIDKRKKEDEEEEEEKDREAQEDQLRLAECAYESLGKAWPRSRETQDSHHQEFCTLMCAGVETSTFKIQVSILKCISQFLDRLVFIDADLTTTDCATLSTILQQIIPVLCSRLGIMKYVTLRRTSVQIINKLISELTRCEQTILLTADLRGHLLDSLNKMGGDPDRPLRDQAADVRKAISNLPALPQVMLDTSDKETEDVQSNAMKDTKEDEEHMEE